jgi:signal transduction histidine kinase/sugar lactone lactonase YvrE
MMLLLYAMTAPSQSQSAYTYDVELILPEEMAQFSYLTGIAEDPDGFIWMSSHKGLSCFDGHQLIQYNNQYTKDSIFLSDQGTGYKPIVTNDNGLHLWTVEHATGKVVVFNTKERQITKIIPLHKGNIAPFIFSSFGHIYAIHEVRDSLEVTSFTNDKFAPQTIDSEEIHIIVDHSNKQQLAYTKKHVISVNEDGKLIKEDIIKSAYKQTIDSVAAFADFDRAIDYHTVIEGKVWLTDRLRNLLFWDRKKKEVENYGIAIDQLAQEVVQNTLKGGIQSILQSSDGSIYLLYFNSLIRLKTKLPKDEDFAEPINSGKAITSMRQITEDDMGNIYASFYTGVAVKPSGSDQFAAFKNTLTVSKDKEATYSLTYYKDQLVWNCSVYDLESDAQSFIHYPFHGAHVNHYLEQDTLWMSFWFTKEWVKHVLTTGETTSLGEVQSDYSYSSSLEQDKEGFFWISTDRAGILKIDRSGKIIKQYSIEELGLKFESDYLYGLYLKDDQVYFGSQLGLGVLNLNTNTTEIFNIPYANGAGKFLRRIVYFILPDENGQLYLGTDHGLVLFDPLTKNFKILIEDHPLANKEFNRNSAYKAKDGRFYVGTVDGLYSFIPEELTFDQEVNTINPPIIYHLQYFDGEKEKQKHVTQNWDQLKMVELGPRDRNFLLEFSSPNTEDVFYAYRVLRLQDEWSPLSTDGKMEIYSLPPGEFNVELKASGGPFQEALTITTLTLKKAQFWYLRWWAIMLYGITGIGIISLYFKNRLQRKLADERKMQNLRTKISSDLHDDVGSLLGGLAIHSELMANQVSEPYQPKLREMSSTSREAMDIMRDTVWAIDPRKDKYENLLDRMLHFAETIFRKKDISYIFDVKTIDGTSAIKPDVRKNVYLIFKEAMMNVSKHSNGDEVHILFQKNIDQYSLSIKDNGTSLSTIKTDGQGLQNMKARAAQINGELSISKEEGFLVLLVF